MSLINRVRKRLRKERYRVARGVKAWLRGRGLHLTRMTPEDLRYFGSQHDASGSLPANAAIELRDDHPELVRLRKDYAALNLPVCVPSRWDRETVRSLVNLRWFRGDNAYVWQYRDLVHVTALRYYVFLRYVERRDAHDVLARLAEDGAFGCWTQTFEEGGTVSRDRLDSANEIGFLQRQIGLLERRGVRVLDIGAGYGRLAHRICAVADVADYCCVDAVPESTFICNYYLHHRGIADRARSLALDRVEATLADAHFDLAINVHSFPEMPYRAIEWWLALIARLRVPYLFVVPNDARALLSLEPDGSRRDFAPLVEAAGYRVATCEPVIDEPDARRVLGVEDHFVLFRREAAG